MPWRVASVSVMPELVLRVTFVDGTTGDVEMRNLLRNPQANGTVFEPLRNPNVFAQAGVVMGAVHWIDGAELAPDAMYDTIKSHGRWIVE